MNLSERYYTESLYPLQDGVMKVVQELKLPFYLTGGTALSRHYFNHRYSDDLDLFVNNDSAYDEHVARIFTALEMSQRRADLRIRYPSIQKSEYFTTFVVSTPDEVVHLKIDLINDVAPHYGDIEFNPTLGRIDSRQNILSNKISALTRFEAKDYADVWIIAKHLSFSWHKVIEEARTKEAGVDCILLYDLIRSFPLDVLPAIKWSMEIDAKKFRDDLYQLAEDMLFMRSNSLLPDAVQIV
jgi:hypothetical protein